MLRLFTVFVFETKKIQQKYTVQDQLKNDVFPSEIGKAR
jgi:hypothetical protein